jgi:hypothetical protein
VIMGRGKKRKHMKDPNAPKRSLWVIELFFLHRIYSVEFPRI